MPPRTRKNCSNKGKALESCKRKKPTRSNKKVCAAAGSGLAKCKTKTLPGTYKRSKK